MLLVSVQCTVMYSCHLSVVCLKTGPWPLQKPVLHRPRSSVSSFNLQYLLFFLSLPSGCLPLLPRLHATHTLPSILSSTKCFRRQFLSKIWPIQSDLFLFTLCTIFLSLTLSITASFFKIFSTLLQHNISKLSRYFWSTFRSVQVSAPNEAALQMQHFTGFFLKL